jgi:hypothetical protein
MEGQREEESEERSAHQEHREGAPGDSREEECQENVESIA